ncbi:DUF6538 domain-containing protein [Methylophaga pinxianii]|uniref:DUF6538 domain-containing protein n=1 Tax=Methylophaga pinxianii TaxID=2881052 RepID=UPI001CF1F756|nr:DUF6538 domain-containing protein [Methylophaga pinxianii]MCB2425572.1 tyrosine-type recombinase/integrase [Methylophaga pinxianii]UPH45033.1 tyrosine-type recombinase/integrase [Methylophaga pinxianii]
MSNYINKKKEGYYLNLRVPKDLRQYYLSSNGKPKEYLEPTLKTRDKVEACKAARKLVVKYEQEFEILRGGNIPKALDASSPIKSVEAYVEQFRAYKRGEIDYPFGEFEPDEFWGIAVDHLPESISPSEKERLGSLWALLNNPDEATLEEIIDKYLDERRPVIREATLNEKRQELEEFAAWIGKSIPVTHIKKKDAGRYVEYLCRKVSKKTKRLLSDKSIRDTVSGLSTLFKWAEGRGLAHINPFDGMSRTIPKRHIGKRGKREWGPDEIKLFLKEAKKDRRVLELFVIALYTGMRGREIAELKSNSPSERFLQIDEAKNRNSIREVPVHPIIQPLITKLRKEAGADGYLIKGLSIAQLDNNRYKNLGTKMGRLRNKLGISQEVDFHSTRRAVAGACERADISQDRAARSLGHKPTGITYARYSDGLKSEQLLEEVALIRYGDGIEEVIKQTLIEVYDISYG